MKNIKYKVYLQKLFSVLNCLSLLLCSFVTVAQA